MPYEELFSDLDFQQATETSRSSPSSASWMPRSTAEAECLKSVGANPSSSSSRPILPTRMISSPGHNEGQRDRAWVASLALPRHLRRGFTTNRVLYVATLSIGLYLLLEGLVPTAILYPKRLGLNLCGEHVPAKLRIWDRRFTAGDMRFSEYLSSTTTCSVD